MRSTAPSATALATALPHGVHPAEVTASGLRPAGTTRWAIDGPSGEGPLRASNAVRHRHRLHVRSQTGQHALPTVEQSMGCEASNQAGC